MFGVSTCGESFLIPFFFVKQKTAYEVDGCDWSSDVALPSCGGNPIRLLINSWKSARLCVDRKSAV